jgi:hypothetical protein
MSAHCRLFPLLAVAGLLGAGFVLALLWPLLTLPLDRAPVTSARTRLDPLRFVDEQGAPVADASLRLLCYEDIAASATPTSDLLFTTNSSGGLQQPLPPDCLWLAAMRVIHRQPAGKPGRGDAYWVYQTSWQAGTRTLSPASGAIVISSTARLVLFDLAVALEWEPADDRYIDNLRAGLLAASANLYDVTEGQMAVGPLDIHTGGNGWDGADLLVRTANDYRPAASVGGIVAQTTTYTTPTGVQTVYAPGMIVVGRHWDGFDANDPIGGAWTQPPAYRTLIHEWLHYALFLYDEYQEVGDHGRGEGFCTCRDLPDVGQNPQACGQVTPELAASVMGYHYTASELWLHGAPDACLKTDQYRIHGESDWATIGRWGAIQGLPDAHLTLPANLDAGPALGLAADLFGRRPQDAVAHNTFLALVQTGDAADSRQRIEPEIQTTRAVTIHVRVNASLTLTELNRLQVQIYTLEPASADRTIRWLYQGTTTGARQAPNQLGSATLLGIRPGAKVWVLVDGPTRREFRAVSYRFSGELDPAQSEQTILTLPIPTSLQLDLQPGVLDGTMQALTVTLTSALPLTGTPTAQLCSPAAAVGCPDEPGWRRTLANTPGSLTWQTIFTAPVAGALPPLGLLQISGGGADLIRWYQTMGAVGPGHRWGHAPMRDGLLMVDATAPISGSLFGVQNLVLMMPMASDLALNAPLPPGIDGLVNLPWDVDVLLPEDARTSDAMIPTPVVLTLFFGRATLDRLGLPSAQAQLLHYRSALNRWEVLADSGRNAQLQWLATKPLTETGIFAIGRAASPGFGQTAQMYADPGPIIIEQPLRYLVVLPANTGLITPTMGFFQNSLPPFILDAQAISCSQGTCFFDPVGRSVQWQGQLMANDRVILHYDLIIDPGADPSMVPPTFINQAISFDGVSTHHLIAVTQLQPVETPVP